MAVTARRIGRAYRGFHGRPPRVDVGGCVTIAKEVFPINRKENQAGLNRMYHKGLMTWPGLRVKNRELPCLLSRNSNFFHKIKNFAQGILNLVHKGRVQHCQRAFDDTVVIDCPELVKNQIGFLFEVV